MGKIAERNPDQSTVGTWGSVNIAPLDDVVKITIFSADIRYRDAINQIRTETFKEPYPASTQVAVTSLVDSEWMVEIEAVAFVSSS